MARTPHGEPAIEADTLRKSSGPAIEAGRQALATERDLGETEEQKRAGQVVVVSSKRIFAHLRFPAFHTVRRRRVEHWYEELQERRRS